MPRAACGGGRGSAFFLLSGGIIVCGALLGHLVGSGRHGVFAPLFVLVTALAVETLRSSKALSAVHDASAPFTADYLLVIDIRRFDAEAADGGPPQVRVVLDCTVGRRSDRGVVASFTAEGVATASETRMGAVVEAFEQAAGQALDSLSEQTLAALKADTSAS